MPESREERLRRLREAAASADRAAAVLLHDELQTLRDKLARLDEAKPRTADQETYDKLIAVVTEATQQNRSIAQLKERIESLGRGAMELAKTLAGAASNLT